MSMLLQLAQAIADGSSSAGSVARQALGEGITPESVLAEGICPGVAFISQCTLLDATLVADAAERALAVVSPYLPAGEAAARAVIGAVQNDLECSGKDLLKTCLRARGYRVIDLDLDVAPQRFVSTVIEHRARALVLHAHLPAALGALRETVQALEASGYRRQVKVLVTGQAVTPGMARLVGADGYSRDPVQGAELAARWLDERFQETRQ